MTRRATILDIAQEAGVSRQTVVRALSGQPRISPSTRARVLEIAARLEYRPNRAAQALVGAPTMMLAMITGDLRNPFFAEVAHYFSTAVGDAGYSVMLMRRPSSGALGEIARRVGSYNVDGAVLYPHALQHAAVEQTLKVVPRLVLIGAASRHDGCAEVILDEQAAVGLIRVHVDEMPTRRCGVISHAGQQPRSHPRAQALTRAFPDAQVSLSRSSARAGYRACQELLASDPGLDCVVAFNDVIGLGALRALIDSGRRVPDDVAVISVDGSEAAVLASPSMTSVTFGTERIAQEAARLVTEDDITSVQLEPTLTIGESSRR